MNGFAKELRQLEKKCLLRKLSFINSRNGSKILINGQSYVNFSSNDYLGLSEHPEIIKAFVSASKRYGVGSGASRLLSGSYVPHMDLEKKIAGFKKTPAALIFNTGYSANTGIIPAVADSEHTIFSDELNHASIIDGIRLSKAKTKIYRHRDVNHLEMLLKKTLSGKKIIITDTVFSMDGDIAPLKDIVFLSRKYKALLMVDDAHGTGVLGKTGRGGLEYFGLEGDDIIQMGTLSKAIGCFGGFVAGTESLVNFLINKARSFIYSTSMPPAIAAACIKAVDIVSESYGLRARLWKNRERLYNGLQELGFDTLDSETPIIPLLAGDAKKVLRLGKHLHRNKIFAPAIRPPTVPEGKCRIRFSVTAAHTEEDIDLVLESLRRWSV